jgi:Fe-S cluster assembly protein SufD
MSDLATTAGNAFAEPIVSERLSAPWLEERRDRAVQTFREKGVPHRRVEDWKYTDLKKALEAANDVEVGTINWTVSPISRGVELYDLADLEHAPEWIKAHLGKSGADAAIPAASLAFAQSGFALRVAKGQHISSPVRVAFSGSGHARVLIVLEEAASLTVVETPTSGPFSNVGIEAVIGPNAHLTHIRLAEKAPSSIQIEDIAVRVARDAAFHAHLVNCGATLSRLNLRLTLKEPGASAILSGASVLGDTLHTDVTTEIYHASGQTQSTQLFKNAVGGKARAVYQGKITVAEGANGSDSRQTAKAILLSDNAEVDLKPELEILADDVKCAHGAATGDLDADSLFYLRSRGVPEPEARNLLIRAFLEDAVLPISDLGLRDDAWRQIESALQDVMEEVP